MTLTSTENLIAVVSTALFGFRGDGTTNTKMYQIKEKLNDGRTILLAVVAEEGDAINRVKAAKADGRDVWYCKE